MYDKVLVPVDGSPLAESVLPHVAVVAGGCGVQRVTFLRVVEPIIYGSEQESAPKWEFAESFDHDNAAAAEAYLNDLVGRTKLGRVEVNSAVVMGRPAEKIPEYAEKNGYQLIILATHGRSGVSRWVWGSVADRVLRSACIPVLMVRAPGCTPGL